MLQLVEQRKYIDDFLQFTQTFCLTEKCSMAEIELVESNLKILLKRIEEIKRTTYVGSDN